MPRSGAPGESRARRAAHPRAAFSPLLPLLLLPLTACDAGSPAEQPIDAPPIHISAILAATGYVGDDVDAGGGDAGPSGDGGDAGGGDAGPGGATPGGQLRYEPISPDGSSYVVSTTAFKIRFDRLLLPITASRQSICLQPLLKQVRSPADCSAGLLLQPTYDPVRHEVTYRQPEAAPALTPGIVYTLTAYVPVGSTAAGFRSFEGTPLEALVRFELGVKPDGVKPPPTDPLPVGEHFCAAPDPSCSGSDCARSVAGILGASGCGSGSCHGGSEPAEGLDTATAPGIAATALGRVAHGAQTGEHGADPAATSLRFGRSMPLVEPGAPGNSYLVYKLLANPRTPLQVPFPGPEGEVAPEIRRVQQTIVTGLPMPPSTPIEAALRPGEAEWIADWILQGAPLPTCP